MKRSWAIPGVPKKSTANLGIPQAPHETQAGVPAATGVTTVAVTYRHSSSPLPQSLPRSAGGRAECVGVEGVLVHTLPPSQRSVRHNAAKGARRSSNYRFHSKHTGNATKTWELV